ncbi:hypothetical protein P153DRAFT_293905, partial [Dothidotthia symphoricarpi CBS 119687]
ALCTVTRLAFRFASKSLRHLPINDDIFVVASSLCSLGSTMIISTAVDSGLGKRSYLLDSNAVERVQLKLFVSTVLFVLAISLSKCPVILFLYRLADNTLQRLNIAIVGILVLIWTTAVMAGVVFQCAMPRPWEMWTGQCIPLVSFWIAAIAVDILIDTALILFPAHIIWTMQLQYHQKTPATSVFSLRVLLVVLSIIRIIYLQCFLSASADPTYASIPYIITTQFQSTISVMLSCTLALKPLAAVLQPSTPRTSISTKHWSGSTVGGAPYTLSTIALEVIKEPLPLIQASMSTPSLPPLSPDRPARDVSPLTRYAKAPPRPPPPSEDQRPDLSMFTQKGTVREPPMVTRLGGARHSNRIV